MCCCMYLREKLRMLHLVLWNKETGRTVPHLSTTFNNSTQSTWVREYNGIPGNKKTRNKAMLRDYLYIIEIRIVSFPLM